MKHTNDTTDEQSELFIVVDRDDNIVGYRTRGECHNDKSLTHRSVSVVLFNDHGEVLLQKRSMTKDTWPGYYTVSASGHVTKGSTYEEAAKREMEEEIGLSTDLTYQTKFYIEEPYESELVAVFTGHYNGPFKINTAELEEAKFHTQEEAITLSDKMTSAAAHTLKVLGILK
ncbi:NUDIX domain-containing protein [Candidatus Microgenomates bacterium]|nr:NUDIX domain-containing protein [Candidatus Microgenomates bacterium]